MLCTKCGLRESTTEVVQRINNHIEKMYLCDECAKDFRPEAFDDFDVINKLIKGSSMGILSGLVNMLDAPTTRSLVCPDCKTTGDEFLKSGYVGCPRCYEVFEPLIAQTVKKLQQSDKHVGKHPLAANEDARGASVAVERERLRAELQSAIDSFDYKRASAISTKLDALDGKGEA